MKSFILFLAVVVLGHFATARLLRVCYFELSDGNPNWSYVLVRNGCLSLVVLEKGEPIRPSTQSRQSIDYQCELVAFAACRQISIQGSNSILEVFGADQHQFSEVDKHIDKIRSGMGEDRNRFALVADSYFGTTGFFGFYAHWKQAGQKERAFRVPLMFLISPIVLLVVIKVRRMRQRKWRARNGLCVGCGYDCSGADHQKCPECGTMVASTTVAAASSSVVG